MITLEILLYCFLSWLVIIGCIIAGDCVGEKIVKIMEVDSDVES